MQPLQKDCAAPRGTTQGMKYGEITFHAPQPFFAASLAAVSAAVFVAILAAASMRQIANAGHSWRSHTSSGSLTDWFGGVHITRGHQ